MPGVYTNGLTTVTAGIPAADVYRGVSGYELAPFDTQRTRGAVPQSVAITPFQIAALAAYMSANTATDGGAGTATLNTMMGRVVLAGASTTLAAGSSYTLTITNSTCAATSTVQAAVIPGANTVSGMVVQSVTAGAGSFVVVLYNAGTAAQDGASVVVFQVTPNQT